MRRGVPAPARPSPRSTVLPLRLRSILAFWLPLAATWLMMSVEGPYLSAVVARLGAPIANLAAFGLAFNLAWLAISLSFVALMIVHQKRGLAVVPATWLGRGQIVYFLVLWIIALRKELRP